MTTTVPRNWSEEKLGDIARVRRGASPRPIDDPRWFASEGPGWIRISDVTKSSGRLIATEQKLSAEGASRSVHVGHGDVIMSICATIGEPIMVAMDACIHDGFVVFDDYDQKLDREFLLHLLRFIAPSLKAQGQTGTQANINTGIVGGYRVCVPDSVTEQTRIARILDTADALIAKSEAVIAKLRQVRSGLLHDLLTRGLDAHGQLRNPATHPKQFKGSPLGRIPKEWEVKNCSQLCREIVVGIVVKPAQYYVSSGVPVLRSANLKEDGIQLKDLVYISTESNELLSKSMLRAGDLVTVRTGYPGTTCVIPDDLDGCNCVDLVISRPGPDIEARYLAHWINSPFGKDQVLRVQGGLAQQHFNVGEMRDLLVATPNIEEQNRIAALLATHDRQLASEQATLSKLRQLKSGLMTDLLEGRVRVPEFI